MVRLGLVLLAGVFCAASCADAADGAGKKKGKRDPEAMFKKLDGNSDSKLSKEEFAKFAELRKKAPKPGKAGKIADKVFGKLDANSDGNLTLDELKKLGERKKKKKSES